MLKYESTLITFTEVPNEISLCFNITNCPCRCEECFEPWLREDRGAELTLDVIKTIYNKSPKITCICFLGGDGDYDALYKLCIALKFEIPDIKLAMYSGRTQMNSQMKEVLDYYKIGPFVPMYGPLNKKTTNQKFYKKIDQNSWLDITYLFQKERI